MRDSEKVLKLSVLITGFVLLILQILFIIFKFTEVGDWVWVIVFLPAIIPGALQVLLVLVYFFSAFRLSSMISRDEKKED